MKKLRIVFAVLLLLFAMVMLAACNDDAPPEEPSAPSGPEAPTLPALTGVTLSDGTFTYDGSAKSLAVQGAPAGASITYTGNGKTDAGTYSVSAVVTAEGYQSLTLQATLVINKATLTGISADATQSVTAGSTAALPSYSGTLPAGVTVKYMLNGAESAGVVAEGTYTFSIVFSSNNYETLTLPVTFIVRNLPVLTGVTLPAGTFTYDGSAKSLAVQGAPAGADIQYTGNGKITAGSYSVSAVVTVAGYQPLSLQATLVINKATLTGISANATQSVTVGSSTVLPSYSGTLPAGVTVKYMLNGAESAGVVAEGTYTFSIVFSSNNYETLTLPVTFIVRNLPVLTGVTLPAGTFTYDGSAKSLAVQGAPAGADIQYTGNGKITAGSYSVSAEVTVAGYQPLSLQATLVINKATLTGISANATQSVTVGSSTVLPSYKGTLPTGISVKYMLNGVESTGVTAIGTYSFAIVFSGDNYETLSLPVTFKIRENLAQVATKVIDSFGTVPNAWQFLPDTFAPQYHAVTSLPDYSAFVNISDIPTNGIGKQMNVVYGLLNKTDKALSYVNTVMGAMNVIKSLYTSFLDSNPDDYSVYTGTAAGFTFTIELGEDTYVLRATVGTVLVELYSNTADKSYGATVKLTQTTVLKYTVADTELRVAMDVLDSASVLLEFSRNEGGNVVGMLYEYLVVAGKELTATSAMIVVDETHTTVIGTKGDFIPTSISRNCEIYENATGKLVGTKVREDMSDEGDGSKEYNTYWFPLYKLSGLTSIKKEDKANLPNADTIYINGYTADTLHSKPYLGLPVYKAASRRFDIEFKTMYFYVYDTETGEYKEESCEIPMLFVQEEKYGDFNKDFASANEDALNQGKVDLVVKANDLAATNYAYEVYLSAYDVLKDAVTHEMITNYCKIKQ